jgi:hypothetical protein
MDFIDYLKRNKKSSLVSKGIKLDINFWENFKKLLNNSEEFSLLLDIPKSRIITWRKKIDEAIQQHNKENQEINKKRRIIKTGKLH